MMYNSLVAYTCTGRHIHTIYTYIQKRI